MTEVGELRSTRPGWSTRPRARPAPDGNARHGMRSTARGGRLSTKLAIDSMRRTRCWTLAFLVVLGLAVPMCAQSADPVDDPLALYTKKQVQYGMNQYCWVDWSLG